MKYVVLLDLTRSVYQPQINEQDLLTGMVFSERTEAEEYVEKLTSCPLVTSLKQRGNCNDEYKINICDRYDGILWVLEKADEQLRYDVKVASKQGQKTLRFKSVDSALKYVGGHCSYVASEVTSTGPWCSSDGRSIYDMDVVLVKQTRSSTKVIKKFTHKDIMSTISECYFSKTSKSKKAAVISPRFSYYLIVSLVLSLRYGSAYGAMFAGSFIDFIWSFLIALGIFTLIADWIRYKIRKSSL